MYTYLYKHIHMLIYTYVLIHIRAHVYTNLINTSKYILICKFSKKMCKYVYSLHA